MVSSKKKKKRKKKKKKGVFKKMVLVYLYAIFTSLTQNLKNIWVDFHQTWYRSPPPGEDELIRF